MKRPDTVWVKNNGPLAHTDRYDGEDFTIEPGQTAEMYADCARLCFGFGEDDKTRAIRRLGWGNTRNDLAEALKRLNAFSFHLSAPVGSGDTAALSSGKVADSSDVREPEARPRLQVNVLEKLAQAQTAAA